MPPGRHQVKWIVFIVAVLASYPVGHWLRTRPELRIHVWTLVGFLPFFARADMALVSFGARQGDTYGVEVALIDWLVLSQWFAHERPGGRLPYRAALTLYLLVAAASVTQAHWALGAFAYVWKLCRMYLLYAAIWRAGGDKRVPAALLRGLTYGLVYECFWALWQHFALGIPRVMGTVVHANSLGMLVNLAVMASIALVLAGRTTRLIALAPIAALLIDLFTVSRGTLLFFGAGCVLIYLVSAFRAYTVRKATIGLAAIALGLVAVPVAVGTLASRSDLEKDRSIEVRRQYERAASLMLQDHPLGVGPNHYTVMLNMAGYGDRAGLPWSDRTAIVHSIYWLTAAEMGYAGLIALVILCAAPVVTAIRLSARSGHDRRGDVLLGLGIALTMCYAHGFFEWVWRANEIQYVYWIIVGMIAILARQIREGAPQRIVAPDPRAPWRLRPVTASASRTSLPAARVRAGGTFGILES